MDSRGRLMLGMLLVVACDRTPMAKFVLDGGFPKDGAGPPPSPDTGVTTAACPAGLTLCGVGGFATCEDLRADPQHCGVCGKACTPGIPCVAGSCRQVACQLPVSFSPRAPVSIWPASAGWPSLVGWILVDVDADGVWDLVSWTSRHNAEIEAAEADIVGSIGIARGNGQGGFAEPRLFKLSGNARNIHITTGDLNSDGVPDLLFHLISFETKPIFWGEVWLGQAGGYPAKAPTIGIPPLMNVLGIGDLNGDGRGDLVVSSASPPPGDTLKVYLADAEGFPPTSTDYRTDTMVSRVFLRDWNGDGSPDIATVGVSPASLALHFNRGDGTFDPAQPCEFSLTYPGPFEVADFNQDGRPDLAYVDGSQLLVVLGKGGCAFHPPITQTILFGSDALAIADVSGDGRLDMVSRMSNGTLDLLPGNPQGSFGITSYDLPPTRSAGVLKVGDMNRDGKPDLILAMGDGTLQIWENTCAPGPGY